LVDEDASVSDEQLHALPAPLVPVDRHGQGFKAEAA
jgi:hypothetical protein